VRSRLISEGLAEKQLSPTRTPSDSVDIELGRNGSYVFAASPQGEFLADQKIGRSVVRFQHFFRPWTNAELVIKSGTLAPWLDGALKKLGHRALVVNPGGMPGIDKKKPDRVIARKLALTARRYGDDLPMVERYRLDERAISPLFERGSCSSSSALS